MAGLSLQREPIRHVVPQPYHFRFAKMETPEMASHLRHETPYRSRNTLVITPS